MKNRNITFTTILLLLACAGLAPVTRATTQDVNVVNTTANPVPVIGTVRDADNPARQAVQLSANVGMLNGQQQTLLPFNIPAGKIFVVEFASLTASVPIGQTLQLASVRVKGRLIGGVADSLAIFELPITARGTFIGSSLFVGSQSMRLYAPPGNGKLIIFASRTASSGLASVQVFLSGYLVDAQ